MATFTFFHEFKKYLGDGTIDLDTHTFKWMLSNTAPTADTDTVKANITEISAAFGYSAGGTALASVTWSETGAGTGIWRFTAADTTFTASGGSFGALRYAVLYDDTPSSPADPLVGYLDHGSSITITDGNSLTIDVGFSRIPANLAASASMIFSSLALSNRTCLRSHSTTTSPFAPKTCSQSPS